MGKLYLFTFTPKYNSTHNQKSVHTFGTVLAAMLSAGLSDACGWLGGFFECLLHGRLL